MLEEMRKTGIEESLISIIASYLPEWKTIVEAENISKQQEVGVSQGSVLEPTLWNILYDKVKLSNGATLIGFVCLK